MDEGRLGAVRRQQGHHRKSTIVMNDIINFQQDVYTCYLKRERQNTEAKMKAQEVYLKRSIARNSYLLQCLEARKQKIAERAPEKQILGRYGGRPIHAFSRDVDACIAWRHPRLRRLRRVERAKEKGLKIGAIMDFDTIPEKMEAIMKKGQGTEDDVDNDDVITDSKDDDPPTGRRHTSKLPHILSIRNQSVGVPNILKLQHTVYTRTTHHLVDDSRDSYDSRDHNDDRLQQRDSLPENEKHHGTNVEDHGGKRGAKTRESDTIIKNHEKDNNNNNNNNSNNNNNNNNNNSNNNNNNKDATKDAKHNLTEGGIEREPTIIDPPPQKQKQPSSPPPPPPLVRRPTLILPPIQTTKDMKLHGFEGQGQGQRSKKDSDGGESRTEN